MVLSAEVIHKHLGTVVGNADSIESIRRWIFQHHGQIRLIVDCWLNVFRAANDELRVALFYLMNDVVQKARQKEQPELLSAFQPVLISAIRLGKASDRVNSVMERVLKILAERRIYSQEIVAWLLQRLKEADDEKIETKPVVSQKQFDKLQGAHNDFEKGCTRVNGPNFRYGEMNQTTRRNGRDHMSAPPANFAKTTHPTDRRHSEHFEPCRNGIFGDRGPRAQKRSLPRENEQRPPRPMGGMLPPTLMPGAHAFVNPMGMIAALQQNAQPPQQPPAQMPPPQHFHQITPSMLMTPPPPINSWAPRPLQDNLPYIPQGTPSFLQSTNVPYQPPRNVSPWALSISPHELSNAQQPPRDPSSWLQDATPFLPSNNRDYPPASSPCEDPRLGQQMNNHQPAMVDQQRENWAPPSLSHHEYPEDEPLDVKPLILPNREVAPPTFTQHSGISLDVKPSIQETPTNRPTARINLEGVKIEGVSENNRIFFDGKAYEVEYVDTTPIIERNGWPHRVYFGGGSRNVIIDGTCHPLAFGETKQVLIDGEEHAIRFGGPSRELFMGDYPFKGTFGGPPIFATINGVRHEIRLGGPAPEVKVEPTPAYELARHLNVARKPQPPTPVVAKPVAESSHMTDDGKIHLSDYLKYILRTCKQTTPPAQSMIDNTPVPIPTGPLRRPHPPDLTSFNVRNFKICYDSVIAQLHDKKNCCPKCGIRKDIFDDNGYKQHLETHVKENLRKEPKNTLNKQRRWYVSLEVWVSDFGQNEATSVKEAEKENVPRAPTTARLAAGDTGKKVCFACRDSFKRVFDDDEEVWFLNDCVISQGQYFHESCVYVLTIKEEVFERSSESELPGLGE